MKYRIKSLSTHIQKAMTAGIVSLPVIAVAQPVGYDFNDDGSSDYPVSVISYDQANPDVGAARIWSGASKSIIHTIVGTETNTLFGWSTGSAGDLDGDGKADLIVGEPFWSAASNYEGRIQVFSGDDASVLLTINGPYADTGLGRYVTGIGDWNGDGTPDIVSSGWDIADTDGDGIGDDPIGMVFVFSGVDGSILAEITDPTATASFGYGVFGLGDINGDSKADIAIVDLKKEPLAGSGIYGEMYIFAGSALVGAFDITDAQSTISNTDEDIRNFGAQIDIMHPDLWLDQPTLQIVSLMYGEDGGSNEAEIKIDILKVDGVQTGDKGLRPSLKLAGDVNVDGKVNALDIQDSISQLGIDPQALGVMPIVDSNNDNIIDAADIQVVMDGYGTTTDVYEGLWDGTRLLSVAGGSAGFGSTSGISIRPVGPPLNMLPTPFRPGIRPIDDCPPELTTPTDLPNATILPGLLREDARRPCAECPQCDEPHRGCYDCENAGSIQGGGISSVTPSQPLLDEPVVFIIEPVTISGRTEKCVSTCGPEGTICPIVMNYRKPDYHVEKYDETTDQWNPVWFGYLSETGNGPWALTYAPPNNYGCHKVRLVVDPETIGSSGNCEAISSAGDQAEVEFAEFTLESACVADTPSDKTRRTVGIGEGIHISVVDGGAASIRWVVNGNDRGVRSSPYKVEAQASEGTLEVIAEINGCQRRISFKVIEPTRKNYIPCLQTVHHTLGQKNIGVHLKMDLDPDNVSFYNVATQEGSVDATNKTGYYESNVAPSHELGPWRGVREDNTVIARDHAQSNRPSDDFNTGSFTWNIPFIYAVTGSQTVHRPGNKFEAQVFVLQTHCVNVSKGGFTTPFGCRTGGTISPNFAGCGINGQ